MSRDIARRLAAAGLFALFAGTASAHAFLKTASPPVGSTVPEPPHQLALQFTEAVEPAFSTVTVQDAGGADVGASPVQAGEDGTRLVLGLHPLPPGTYTVTWHATSVDTHKTQGSFSFTVAR